MNDLDLLDAELVGARPDYVSKLSPGATAEYNKQVAAYFKKGMKPDDVDRAMGSYGPSYFEDRARASARSVAPAVRAAGGAALAAKNCGADGDPQAWLLLLLCVLALCLIWFAASQLRRPAEPEAAP